MNIWFFLGTVLFIVISASMVLIILVQRPQGGGLAGAFGGAGGGGTDSVFGGRVGDALTVITVVIFIVYITLAITLNKIPIQVTAAPATTGTTAGSTNPQAPISVTPAGSGPAPTIKKLDGPPPDIDPSQLIIPTNTDPATSDPDTPPDTTSGDPDTTGSGDGSSDPEKDDSTGSGDDDSEQA